MNGQQKSKQNINAFELWAASQTDDDFRQITHKGQLHRGEIAKATGIGKPALRQNPAIKRSLEELENKLRERKILPLLTCEGDQHKSQPQLYDVEATRRARNDQRASRLEQENVELKARVKELERRLARFGELSDAITEMGMVPR
jgi:uncharacterized protein YceH (UPF0502 family)